MAGAYEREAIRPHVLGRFADMLLAVESHPAMLFYLDNVESMGAEFDRRHQSRQGPQRKSRPRDPGIAYARRPQRLYADRRHELRQCADRLDLDQTGRSRTRRRIRLHQAPARARRPDRAGQGLSRCRRRSGPRRARRSGAASGDGAAYRAKARARISSPTNRRRRWSPNWQRPSTTAAAISRKLPRRWSSADESWTPQRTEAQAAGRVDRRRPSPGRRAGEPSPIGRIIERTSHARRAAVAAAGAERLSRHRSGLDRRRAAPPRHRQRIRRPGCRRSIRWRCSTAGSARSPPPTRARPSRAPRAARKPWRFSS